jgi:hypothetical protein
MKVVDFGGLTGEASKQFKIVSALARRNAAINHKPLPLQG